MLHADGTFPVSPVKVISGDTWNAVQIAPNDNTAVALRDIEGSASIRNGDKILELILHELIPMGHKFALCDLPSGTEVLKFGSAIGITTMPIAAGHHVHVHNMASQRAGSNARGAGIQAFDTQFR
jgi:altronate dehydratase